MPGKLKCVGFNKFLHGGPDGLKINVYVFYASTTSALDVAVVRWGCIVVRPRSHLNKSMHLTVPGQGFKVPINSSKAYSWQYLARLLEYALGVWMPQPTDGIQDNLPRTTFS